MKSISRFFSLAIVVVLSFGCATVKQQTGFSLEQANPQGVEQPYRAVAAEAIKFEEVKVLTAVVIPLDKADMEWIGELGVMAKGEKGEKTLCRREAWRGWVNIDGNINPYGYPALITKLADYLYLLVPNVAKDRLIGKQAVIFSGASTRAMTPDGRIYDLPKIKGDMDRAREFFKSSEAHIESYQVADLSPGTPAGDAFIASIKKRFPILLKIGDRDLMATTSVVDASEMTSQDNMVDKIISRGNLPASLLTILSFAHPIGAGIQSTRIFYGLTIAATDEEMRGPYGETKYPGWAVGQVLGYYLKENHRLIEKYRASRKEGS